MFITLESIVPVQADRDELVQLLNLIDFNRHQNEEAFSNRSLTAWPKWCEDEGFRFDLLKKLALNLESTLTYPKGSSGLNQIVTALGPAATTAQLMKSLCQHLPQFLEGFDELLKICQEESAALGAQAGGTTKEWIKNHPRVDLATGVVLAGAGSYGLYRWFDRREIGAEDRVQEGVEVRVEDFDTDDRLQARRWIQYERNADPDSFMRESSEIAVHANNEFRALETSIENGETNMERNLVNSEESKLIEGFGSKLVAPKIERAQSELIKKVDGEISEEINSFEKNAAKSLNIAVNNELKDLATKEVNELESEFKPIDSLSNFE